MTKFLKNILSLITNVIKYPFLGLFFVTYNIIKALYLLVKYIFKGITYIFYFPIVALGNIFKKNKEKTNARQLIKAENKQRKLNALNDKKIIQEEQRRKRVEERNQKAELIRQQRLEKTKNKPGFFKKLKEKYNKKKQENKTS